MLYIYLQIRFALAHEVIILPIDVCVCVSYSNALAIILPITTLNEFIQDSSYRTTYRNVLHS